MMDILALNLSQPYHNKSLTHFEPLHAVVSPVNGIPMTEDAMKELVERKWVTDKKNAKELSNSNPETKNSGSQDTHKQTQEERELSK